MAKIEKGMKTMLTGMEALRQARGCDIVLDDDGGDWSHMLPLDSVKSLEKFDNRLSTDQTFRNRVVIYLARYATKQIPESIRQIFSQLITDELALNYSFQGRSKTKKNFSSLSLSEVIMSAVRSNVDTSACNLKDLQIEGGKYLTKAKFRMQQRDLRKTTAKPDYCEENQSDSESSSSSSSGSSSSES